MKTGIVPTNRTFGFSFQSSGIVILIFYQNSLIHKKRRVAVKIFLSMLSSIYISK